MTIDFGIRLREDISGEAGEVLENDIVNLGSPFFLEILGGDFRTEATGLMSTLFEVDYDPAVIDSLDNFDSLESPLLTAKFAAVRTGNIDEETGLITQFGGGSLPNWGVGEAVGVGELETIALLRLEAITDVPSSQVNLAINLDQTNFAGGIDVAPDNINSLEKSFIINTPPSAIALNNLIPLPENIDTSEAITVATISASDPDENDPATFTLIGGRDEARFRIEEEQLILESGVTLDFEEQESLEVEILATDRAASVSQVFTIPITDVDELPSSIELSNQSIQENVDTSNPFPVGTLSAIDPEGEAISFTVTGGENADQFLVEEETLFLAAGVNLDFRNEPILNVEITASDREGDAISQTFAIEVIEVNVPPSAIALSNQAILENTPTPVTVGTLSATDPNTNESITFNITGGEDAAQFNLVGNELIITSGVTLDRESQDRLNLEITATDRLGESLTREFEITILDQNEPPSAIALSNQEIPENTDTSNGAFVGTINATDPEGDTISFSLVGGEDVNQFEIRNNRLLITSGVSLNHEQQSELEVEINARDEVGNTTSESFSIEITDVNEAPRMLELDKETIGIGEDTPLIEPTLVGTLSAIDPEGEEVTFTLTGGEDESLFLLSENRLFIFLQEELDRKSNNLLTIEITASDPQGLTTTELFSFPTIGIELSTLTIPEDADITQPVATISAIDEGFDQSFVYEIVGGEDAEKFLIQGNRLFFNPQFNLNFEVQPNLEIEIGATDTEGETLTEIFNLTVIDVNESPLVVRLARRNIPENPNLNQPLLVGTLSTFDPEEREISFSITGGRNADAFSIQGNRLFLSPGEILDLETEPILEVEITASDPQGNTATNLFPIDLTDLIEARIILAPGTNPNISLEREAVSAEIEASSDQALERVGLKPGNRVLDELLSFTLTDVTEGEAVTLEVTIPEDQDVNNYFLFDPQRQQWFEFVQSERISNGLGARFEDRDSNGRNETVILTLTDGGFGDLDGEVNGEIKSTGNAFLIPDSGQLTLNANGNLTAIAPAKQTVNLRHQIISRDQSQDILEVGFTLLEAETALPETPEEKLSAIAQGTSLFSVFPESFPNGEPGQFNAFNLSALERLIAFSSRREIAYYLITENNLTSDTVDFNNIEQVEFAQFDIEEREDDFLVQSDSLSFTVDIASTETVPLGTKLQAQQGLEVFDFRENRSEVTATLSFDLISFASFDNILGFYAVEAANGMINNIVPGDANYLSALLDNVVQNEQEEDILLRGGTKKGFTFALEGGKIIVPFIVSNGGNLDRISDQSDDLPSDINIYTPFLEANSDRADHFRLLADNALGIEDLPGGGDQDFNDLIFQLDFA